MTGKVVTQFGLDAFIILTVRESLPGSLFTFNPINTMQPMNNKSLFAFTCGLMEQLSTKIITPAEAKAQADLIKQANQSLKYELDRVKTEIKVREFNVQVGANVELRQIEPKGFENTTATKE